MFTIPKLQIENALRAKNVLDIPKIGLTRGNALPQIVSPGPVLFPRIPSAQGNQLGSLPMGGPRYVFDDTAEVVQTRTVSPQRNFIGRRVIAIYSYVLDGVIVAPTPGLDQVYLTQFLVGAQNQLGSGDPIHIFAMVPETTGAGFTLNQVQPGLDYSMTVAYLGGALVRGERIVVSFTIYGDVTR